MWIDTPKLIDIYLTFKENEYFEQTIQLLKEMKIPNISIDVDRKWIGIYEYESKYCKYLTEYLDKTLPKYAYVWTESCEYDY